jgi:hypothetical protein
MSESYYQFEINGEVFVIPVEEREHAENILRAAIASAEVAVTIHRTGGTFQAGFASKFGGPFWSWDSDDLEECEYREVKARRPRRPILDKAKCYILS